MQGVKWVVTTIRDALSGLHFTIEDMIAEGDKVVTLWTARETHQDHELLGTYLPQESN
jgi:predicted ester cyclase